MKSVLVRGSQVIAAHWHSNHKVILSLHFTNVCSFAASHVEEKEIVGFEQKNRTGQSKLWWVRASIIWASMPLISVRSMSNSSYQWQSEKMPVQLHEDFNNHISAWQTYVLMEKCHFYMPYNQKKKVNIKTSSTRVITEHDTVVVPIKL